MRKLGITNKKNILLLISSLFLFSLYGEITFNNPDLNNKDELLFTVEQKNVGANPYNTLFYTQLAEGKPSKAPEVITCYPEQMELLNGGDVLQIRNRYGIARYTASTDSLKWIKTLDEIPEQTFPTAPYAVSPNGKYFCRIEKDNLITGKLILEDSKTGKNFVLANDVLLSYKDLPVKWAPDSSILLYEKEGAVYFCNPEAVLRDIEVEERYRKIGRGTINSVCWASSKYIAYIDDYLLYKISIKELYTLGLYSGIMGQGKAMGRLPFQFDPQTDKFSASKNVSSIMITQNSRLFTYLTIQSDSCDYMDVLYSRPYTDSSASLVNSYVFWDFVDNPILWQEKLPYNGYSTKASVYRIGTERTKLIEIQDSGKPIQSPDGNKLAFYAGSSVYIYDINSWQRLATLSGEKITSLIWIDDVRLYVGGEKSVQRWNYVTGDKKTVTISSAEAGFWNNEGNEITAQAKDGSFYQLNRKNNTWTLMNTSIPVSASTQNGRYRVFLGTTQNRLYENALYVRALGNKAITTPVFDKCVEKSSDPKKVALIFDFYDNSDGLPEILSTLKKYNVPGTFFLNGEFIRRYPSETKQIVANGYNCASMFFTTVSLTDNSFIINEDFVRRGLARNEDEFYDCTGEELLLYWHAPYYTVRESGKKFGNNAGYSYVEPVTHKLEFDNFSDIPKSYIEFLYQAVEQEGGGVIPIVGGFSQGYHKDPLYNYLDILISILIEGGYELVDITELQ